MKKISKKRLQRLLCTGLILGMALSSFVLIRVAAESRQGSQSADTSPGTITIGDTTFSSEADETSGWDEGNKTGWKNLPGQYVTLVDYNGAGKEISADSGVLTLGVAGVNRIGTLKGDCSVNIFGTGIVLIDKIELGEGQTLSLMPNTALYDTGSAAVFLKQENDDSYLLINGKDIPGILDEDYTLDNVTLRIPKDSSIILNAFAVRREIWPSPDGEKTDITKYYDSVPWQDLDPHHYGGTVSLEGFISRLTLGNNSTLIVEDGASVQVKQITTEVPGALNFQSMASELVLYGNLENNGVVKGGFVDVNNGGYLYGTGTVQSSEVTLKAGGRLSESVLLDECGLTITGDNMTVSAQIQDSAIYLKAGKIFLSDLFVAGTCYVGVDSVSEMQGNFSYSEIGNITKIQNSPGASLSIVCNDHIYQSNPEDVRFVEDFSLTISGRITGCTVEVLAGCVIYTGPQTDSIPVAPDGFISRVYIPDFDIDSTNHPLNMSRTDGTARSTLPQIPVLCADVRDVLISERVLAREWAIQAEPWGFLTNNPLERKENGSFRSFTCESFLDLYGIPGEMSDQKYFTAVEVIRADLSRDLFYLNNPGTFSTENVILIRVINVMGQGGQGGSSVSHTETNFSGNGTLGGTVDGSATTGDGTVVYPINNNTEPTTQEPESTTAEPESTTAEPESTTAEPEPTTAEPETTAPKESTTGKETGKKETGPGNGSNIITENNNEYSVQVTDTTGTQRNARVLIEDKTYPSANINTPAYRKLSVRAGGEMITDLPEMITVETVLAAGEKYGANLYAVFVDENENLKVFPATYDAKEKKCYFETDVTGNYVFVQLEDASLSESELIKACRASDEVRLLITIMRLQAFWG